MIRYSQVSQFEEVEIQQQSPHHPSHSLGTPISFTSPTTTSDPEDSNARIIRKQVQDLPAVGVYLPTSVTRLASRQRRRASLLPLCCGSNKTRRPPTEDAGNSWFCMFACLLVTLILVQVLVWYFLQSGQDWESLYETLGRHWKAKEGTT